MLPCAHAGRDARLLDLDLRSDREHVTGRESPAKYPGRFTGLRASEVVGLCQLTLGRVFMRRFLVIAGTVLAFGGVSATGALAAQPNQSCQATVGPAFPGNTAN